MPSRSPFAKRSSTSALLVAATLAAAAAGATGWAFGSWWLAAAGLSAATAFAAGFAVYLIVTERRRHSFAEDELQGQASFLESLVESIASISSLIGVDKVTERTAAEASRLFGATQVRFVPAGEESPRAAESEDGRLLVPIVVRGESAGVLELERAEPFHRWDVIRATVLADVAARTIEISRLLEQAREREEERTRLTEQVITAEQDERRRLSLFLHDGPLQSMAGIALMHDAALAAIEDGRNEDAAKVMRTSLERERDTIRTLRDLTFAIEPLVLRDHGFSAAVRALADQVEQAQRITVSADVGAGDRLAGKAQVALYQIIRESLTQAVGRKPQLIEIVVDEGEDGGFSAAIADNGLGERRRGSIEPIDERVRLLNGRMTVEHGDDAGTVVRVLIPAYVAAAGE
jgi:signal transduction histidine kinase